MTAPTTSYADDDPTAFWLAHANERFLNDAHTDPAALDADLAALASVLRLGRARRNRMSLAARLPPEVLAVVFEFVKQESFGEYEDMGDKDRKKSVSGGGGAGAGGGAGGAGEEGGEEGEGEEPKVKVMGWITFSVALSTPGLWREIKFSHTGPKWAYEMVQRSKAAPLHVELGSGPHANPYWPPDDVLGFTKHILRLHAPRIRTFTIFGEDIAPLATQLISSEPFPGVRFLHIENTSPDAIMSLSFGVLAARVPAAAELCVIGVLFQGAPAAPMAQLTYFDLQITDVNIAESIYAWNLLDILAAMPALQHLYITDAYPAAPPPPARAPVELAASLETLTLTARRFPAEMARFSALLSHPKTFRDFDFSDAPPAVVCAVLSAHVGPARPPKSVYLELDHVADKVIFSASFAAWAASPDGCTPTPLNDVSLTVSGLDAHADKFVAAIDLSAVLDLTFMDDAADNARWAALARARSAQRLRVIGPAAHALFDALASPEDLLFPSVEALSVIEMPEQAGAMGEVGSGLKEAGRLEAALAARRAMGRAVRELRVPDRLLEGDWLDGIRQHVESVGGSRPRFY